MEIGMTEVTVSSYISLLSHASSATSLLKLLYSASAKERKTVACFIDFQAIRVLPKNTTKPLQSPAVWTCGPVYITVCQKVISRTFTE